MTETVSPDRMPVSSRPRSTHARGSAKSGVLIGDVVGKFQGVEFYDAFGNADEFGVSAVIEEQVATQILGSPLAVEALPARSGIGGNHPLAGAEAGDALTHRHNVAGQFVAKQCRGYDHAGVVAAAEHFDIGSASQRRTNPHQYISAANRGHGDLLYLEVFLAVQDSSQHLRFHYDNLWG